MSGDTFFIAARVCFGTKQTIGQTVLKSITGHSRHQMTSGPYRTLMSTFFIPPHRLSSVLRLSDSQAGSRRGGGVRVTALNRGHQYSGSASHTVPGKIISASSPHRFKSVHLRLWIRNWLQTKRLINTAEIQNYPQRRLTHQPVLCTTQQRCVSAGPLSLHSAYHMT